MNKRTRRPLRDQVRNAHTLPTPKDEEIVWHNHRCDGAEFNVAGLCAQCELGLEPADKQPAEPHGWVSCAVCGVMVIACPLGVAEGEGLHLDEAWKLPEVLGAGA